MLEFVTGTEVGSDADCVVEAGDASEDDTVNVPSLNPENENGLGDV